MNKWTPKRITFYPDGHRRWASKAVSEDKDLEEALYISYRRGAETCVRLVEVANDMEVEMVDIFLTRPSTYESSVQARTSQSIVSIHKAIYEHLVKPLDDKGFKIETYTRADLPKYTIPPQLKHKEEVGSWDFLTKNLQAISNGESTTADLTVNLLVNYDGFIESQVLRQIIEEQNVSLSSDFKSRFLPIKPSVDILLRTAPDDTNSYRISSGPVLAFAETSMVVIPKANPEVTLNDLEESINQVMDFRDKKIHMPTEINKINLN